MNTNNGLALLLLLLPALISSFQEASFLPLWRPTLLSSRFGRTDRSSSADEDEFTLEYSPNFRRHTVRKNGNVVQSFAWLDEAVESFPTSVRLPVPKSVHGDELLIAGGGGTSMKENTYPISDLVKDRRESNEEEIHNYLTSTLGWYKSQVESFLEDCPYVLVWPVEILHERIGFLLAPLPEDDVVAEVNATVIDWPVQFYVYNRGAGMSVGQVSHALSVMPSLLFRDLQTETLHSQVNSEKLRRAKYLYEETPAVVLDLTRKQLDALYGASSTDCVSYSYLHWKGWEFHQIRVVLQAFPGSVACSVEASWELFGRGTAPTRKILRPDALVYLQHRLQIGPSHLQAMLKTHPTMSYYPSNQLQRNCDALQENLKVSSNELRSLVLRMPSLLGMSVSSLKRSIHFWTEGVGLSSEQLKRAVCSQPSLMQYAVEGNLRPKLLFFRELGLSRSTIKTLAVKQPSIWGRSLNGHLRPLCTSMCARCGNMTADEFGDILQRAPLLALSNWKQNLSIKLDYLAERLLFSPTDVKHVVLKQPQILLRGMESYIEPRLELMEDRTSKEETRQAVLHSPAILLAPLPKLQARLDRAENAHSDGETLSKRLAKKSRRSRPVGLLASDGESIERRFVSAEEAANYASVSKHYMWQILRQKRSLRGRRYIVMEAETNIDASVTASSPKTVGVAEVPKSTTTPTVSSQSSLTRDLMRLASLEPRSNKLTIYVAGRAFPPEYALRGRRRAGGMALQVPSWTVQDWKKVVPRIWKGQRYRLLSDGRTLLLGYPYMRPSRTRCSLFACREALRAARVWMKEHTDALLSTPGPLEIEIVTDSNL
eukprot:scaffold8647_cov183-Amphora_coffeaeformis.AAC.3